MNASTDVINESSELISVYQNEQVDRVVGKEGKEVIKLRRRTENPSNVHIVTAKKEKQVKTLLLKEPKIPK